MSKLMFHAVDAFLYIRSREQDGLGDNYSIIESGNAVKARVWNRGSGHGDDMGT
jgi:hypothetical protein